ncbi:MAG TPA: hypothetical protein VKW08_18650 [Xanthobacteraceae bacterium]|jgi:hypothetical protein|nr:hypothetical protein [Xanthobacteraceae bacterium]
MLSVFEFIKAFCDPYRPHSFDRGTHKRHGKAGRRVAARAATAFRNRGGAHHRLVPASVF